MAMDVDIKLLRMFATLARVESHTRAAKILNLTQSAVSHGMKRLEEQLGCALIYKKGKSAHLTPEGRHFLGQVLRILDSLDRATESVSGRWESRTKLSVVFSSTIANSILASVLREFRESYPNFSLSVRLEDSPAAIKEVEEGRADLAVVVESNLPPGIKAHRLFKDQLQLLFSPMHPWNEKTKLTVRDLRNQHFLLYQRTSTTFRQIEEYFLQSGVRLSSFVEIPSFEIMKQLARFGLGVAIMAPWVAAAEIEQGSLVALPTPQYRIEREWAVIRQANREVRQSEQTFIGLCRLACEAFIQ